jgi:hypothetical protein
MVLDNQPVSNLTLANCSASHEQNNWPCNNTLINNGSWAYQGRVPAWIEVELENNKSRVSGLTFTVDETKQGNPTLIKVELYKGSYVEPTWVVIGRPTGGVFQQETGKISLPPKTKRAEIEFDPVDEVTHVKLHIFQSDVRNNNAFIRHIEVMGSVPVDGYHFQDPTPIGWVL